MKSTTFILTFFAAATLASPTLRLRDHDDDYECYRYCTDDCDDNYEYCYEYCPTQYEEYCYEDDWLARRETQISKIKFTLLNDNRGKTASSSVSPDGKNISFASTFQNSDVFEDGKVEATRLVLKDPPAEYRCRMFFVPGSEDLSFEFENPVKALDLDTIPDQQISVDLTSAVFNCVALKIGEA
ncbi:hypothetical protein K458DRAFT_488340 [Lentithecium fluviatile CBS 122367]|uniref:Uncharacterized protein n=1 Tax=Lentithecium fluviatile CBS 122367 TaxID=1168545 RepID=A0A6G1IY55_9PLEO|nr:hypothetical protein K458DRAFT_488340 [Lentithecium fluviatile CBS 122367]